MNEHHSEWHDGEGDMERVSGWKMFAGIMLMIVGFMNCFDGLVARR